MSYSWHRKICTEEKASIFCTITITVIHGGGGGGGGGSDGGGGSSSNSCKPLI